MTLATRNLHYQPHMREPVASIWNENPMAVKRREADVPIRRPIINPELYSEPVPK